MPELPEVETIVRSLSVNLKELEVSSFTLLFPSLLKNRCEKGLEELVGNQIINTRRRGKIVIIDFDNDISLLFHLKMTGQLLISPSQKPIDKHTHFILSFKNKVDELRFRDIRKFGSISCFHTSKALNFSTLGPEPFEISLDRFQSLFRGRKARLKSLLLNQNFIAGIGNIYADEILFEAKLHPLTSVSLLNKEELEGLWKAMRLVLKKAIEQRGSSIRDFKDAEGRRGNFQRYHQVYGRRFLQCRRCGKKIERLRLGGRSSFFCPGCQKEKRRKRLGSGLNI